MFAGAGEVHSPSGCLVKYSISNIPNKSNVKSGPVTSRNRPHIDSLAGLLRKIFFHPKKLYHSQSVLARGVFFIPKIGCDIATGKD